MSDYVTLRNVTQNVKCESARVRFNFRFLRKPREERRRRKRRGGGGGEGRQVFDLSAARVAASATGRLTIFHNERPFIPVVYLGRLRRRRAFGDAIFMRVREDNERERSARVYERGCCPRLPMRGANLKKARERRARARGRGKKAHAPPARWTSSPIRDLSVTGDSKRVLRARVLVRLSLSGEPAHTCAYACVCVSWRKRDFQRCRRGNHPLHRRNERGMNVDLKSIVALGARLI